MAGTDPRFNSTTFRDAIHFAMNMGKPEQTRDEVIWMWTPTNTFANTDPGGAPLVWTEPILTQDAHAPVTITCAYEFTPSGLSAQRLGGTSEGVFDTGTLAVTVMDVDFVLLFNDEDVLADTAVIGDDVYKTMYVGPPVGLFDVTVYTIYLQAVDES